MARSRPTRKTHKTVVINTDGSSLTHSAHGAGGWAAIVQRITTETVQLSDGEAPTTPLGMELTAAIKALESLLQSGAAGGRNKTSILVKTDSLAMVNGITKHFEFWKTNDWMTKSNKPLESRELWQRLDGVVSKLQGMGYIISWQWISGHTGDPLNETCDRLAREKADAMLKLMSGGRAPAAKKAAAKKAAAKKAAAKKVAAKKAAAKKAAAKKVAAKKAAAKKAAAKNPNLPRAVEVSVVRRKTVAKNPNLPRTVELSVVRRKSPKGRPT